MNGRLDLIQAWILGCSLAGMIFTRKAFRPRVRRWGYLALVAAQPGWFVSVLTAEPFQWAVFALVCVYTVIWCSAALEAWGASK